MRATPLANRRKACHHRDRVAYRGPETMTIRRASLAFFAALLASTALPAIAAEPSPCLADAGGPCDAAANKLIADSVDRFEKANGEAQVLEALALVDLVAKYRTRLSDDNRFSADTGLWIYFRDDREPGDANYQRVTGKMRGYATRAAAAKDVEGELFFLDWMSLGLSYEERLSHARLIHRRAAQHGLLAGEAASSARVSLEIYGRELLEQGRYAEVARARR